MSHTQKPSAVLKKFVANVAELIGESTGVAGLHMNGDVAEWADILPGGKHEGWLGSPEEASEAADQVSAEADLLGEAMRLLQKYVDMETMHVNDFENKYYPKAGPASLLLEATDFLAKSNPPTPTPTPIVESGPTPSDEHI